MREPAICGTRGVSIDSSPPTLTYRHQLNSDNPYQAEPVDVWGIGVILFTLLLGSEPNFRCQQQG